MFPAITQVQASKVSESSKFKEDLGLDSLDAVEVVMAIEDEVRVRATPFLCA